MATLLVFLLFAVFGLMIYGLINPKRFHLSRKNILIFFGGAVLIIFIIGPTVAPIHPPPSPSLQQTNYPPLSTPTTSISDTKSIPTPAPSLSSEPIKFDSVINFSVPMPKYPDTSNAYKKEAWKADGIHYTLILQNRYDDITIKINGEVQLVGTYGRKTCLGINRCNELNSCYDYDNQKIIFCRVPPKNSLVEFTGLPIPTQPKNYYLSEVECKQILDELKEYQQDKNAFPSNLSWRIVDQFAAKYKSGKVEPYYLYHLPDSYCGDFLKGFLETYILLQ